MACRKAGIAACLKRWGPLKERGSGNSGSANKLAIRKAAPEPSRQIPTAIGFLISGEERIMLEHLYSDPNLRETEQALPHLYKRLIFNYGLFIECPSIRFALLAYSAARQFKSGMCGNESRIDEYSTRGCQALTRKLCSEFDVEEMFTMLFILRAETERYFYYNGSSRSQSDLLRARLAVHARGMHALLENLGDRLRVTTTERFGKEIWDVVVNWFATGIGPSTNKATDLINLSSFYRQQIPEIHNCHQSAIRYRDIALGNTVAGLVKMLLQGCIEGEMGVFRISLEQELDGYLSLSKTITSRQTIMTSETKRTPRQEQYRIMQYYAGKIILHISKELAVSFTWVQEVVSAALSLNEWAMDK